MLHPALIEVEGFDLFIWNTASGRRLVEYQPQDDRRILIEVSRLGSLAPVAAWNATINDQPAYFVSDTDPDLANKAFKAAERLAEAVAAAWPAEFVDLGVAVWGASA